MKHLLFCFALLAFGAPAQVQAQQDTTLQILDDLQFDVRSVKVAGDTAVIDLFLLSSQKGEREFRMNTYASTVVDQQENDHMYTQIRMGRVQIRIEDRQNYLNHILQRDVPVALHVTVAGWKQSYGQPSAVRVVFEDSREDGKFREFKIKL